MVTLSVIIPCFNSGKLLLDMLDCCKTQTFSDWEVIVVDDGSTDNTLSLLREYAQTEQRVHIYQRSNELKGANSCRNIGYKNSKGKYTIFFDADDLIADTCFEKRVAYMDTHPECDYASFPAKTFSDVADLPTFESDKKAWGVATENEDILSRFLSADYPFTVWTNIYRSESIKDVSWNENVKIYQDFCFIVDGVLAGLNHSYSGLKEIDYFYREGNNQSNNMCSNFISDERCKSTIYLFNNITSKLIEKGMFRRYKRSFRPFLILQFERLLMIGEKQKVYDLIDQCTKPYRINNRLKAIYALTCSIKNNKIKRGVTYLLIFGLFGYVKYINDIIKQLKNGICSN